MFFLRPVHRYIVPCFPHVCTGFPPSSQKFSLLTNCVCGLNQGTKQPFNLWPVITCIMSLGTYIGRIIFIVRFHHWITNGVFKYNLSTYNSVKSQTLGGFAPKTPRPRTLTVTYMYLSSPLMCWTTPFLKKTLNQHSSSLLEHIETTSLFHFQTSVTKCYAWPQFDLSRSFQVKDNGAKWNLIYDFLYMKMVIPFLTQFSRYRL